MEKKIRMKNNRQKIINILKHFEIPYWTEGKNVSVDSVNICCPFCDDKSNHCGIFQDTMVFNCWRCSQKGPFKYLLSELTHFSEDECHRIIEEFDTIFRESTVDQIEDIFNKENEVRKHVGISKVSLPEYFEKITLDIDFPLLDKYLNRRKISFDIIIKYRCGICRVGQYMNRMIIPVFLGNEVVAYQAADLTGRAEVKYRTGPLDVEINNYLYNYDNIKENGRMIITEGILDCWRTGDEAVATFGTHITEKQKQLILDRKLKELIICWDGEAYWQARKVIEFFRPFISNISIIKLPGKEDPDSLGREEVFKLIEEENKGGI